MEQRSKRIGASRAAMMKRRMSSSREGNVEVKEPREIPEISSRRKGRFHTLAAREFHCLKGGIGYRRDITFSEACQNEHLQAEHFAKFTSDS